MEDDQKSLFNAGIAKLKRIDALKSKIHRARIDDDFSTWASCLEGWREEMAERMNADQDKECNKFENNIANTINGKNNGILLSYLKKYGICLSRLEYKFGFSMPNMDDASNALK